MIEFGIAVGAGVAAGSIALIGFGADSLIEFLAGTVILWLFTGGRGGSAAAEAIEAEGDQLLSAAVIVGAVTAARPIPTQLVAG